MFISAIAFFVLSLGLPWTIPWSSTKLSLWQKVFHAQALVMAWLFSSLYHTFMNNDTGGRGLYGKLLAADVFGIWMAQVWGELY